MQIADITTNEKETLNVAMEKHIASLKRQLTTATPRFKELINQDLNDALKIQSDIQATKVK